MKKILITIGLILICYLGYGQTYPVPINVANAPTQIGINNAFKGKIILTTFTDTTEANAEGYLKNYDGALIKTTSPIVAIWYRYLAAQQWVQLLPGGGSTGTLAWVMGGNNPVVSDGSGNAILGAQTNNGIALMTNNTQRIILPAAGLTFNQVVSDTTLNKVLTYNTSTKNLGYSYWFGGGAATTPISSLTAAAASNTISNANYTQQWQWALTSGGGGLQLLNTSATSSGNEKVFEITTNGVHGSNNITTYGGYITNSHSGTGSINVALNARAVNGDENIAAWFGRGKVRLGTTSFEKGILEILGNTSGTVTIQPAAAAGTWTMTLPTTDGNSGEYLQTDGNGVTSWAAVTEGANTALSNLASVAINTSLLPGTTNSIALGNTSKIWSDVQTDYFHTGGLNGTYGGYSGGQLGGVSTHAVLDFYDANTRIGEFYTTSSSFNFFTGVGKALNFYTNNSTSIPLLTGSGTSAQLGVNMTTPAAQLHISAGSTAAGSAPLKFTAGTNMTAAEAGAMEWDGTNLFITQTTGPTRKTIAYTSDLTGLPYIALTGTSNATGNIELSMNSGPYDFSISEANTITLDASVGTKTLYFKSQAISSASVGDALTVVNTTTGEIGTAPNLAFNFQKEKTMIYAKNGRLFAEDATGNLTAISPHWFTEEFKPSEEMAWSFYSRNEKIGKEIFIDMLLLARKVEEWTGEKLVYIKDIPKK